jgi:hypothetical protein
MTFGRNRLASAAIMAVLLAGGCASGTGQSGPATRPTSDAGLNERQREVARVQAGRLGFVQVLPLQAGWLVDDLADKVSGTAGRLGHMMADKTDPDIRRKGIMGLADRPWGETPTYTRAYAAIAGDDKEDYLVRASAIRAINRSRDPVYRPLFVSNLNDSNEVVRLEACKALNRMPDPAAVPTLIKLVARQEESKDVRIAAAEALRHYKKLEVARSLISLLGERDFGIAWQAHHSLRDLTRKDLGYDEGAWLSYLSGPEKPLS